MGTGSIERATERVDGTMEATIRIKEDEIAWDPAILVLPHGGDLELTVINDDKNTHSALFPSNGDKKFLWLLNHSKGRAKLNLDGPGYYWYSSPGGNDEGRGLKRRQAIPEPEHQGDLHGTAQPERKRPERDRRPEVVQAEDKAEDEELDDHMIVDCCNRVPRVRWQAFRRSSPRIIPDTLARTFRVRRVSDLV